MQANTWAMLCHLGGLVGYFGNGIGSVIAPLIVWVIKKDEMPEVDYHGKEALNFNISIFIYFLVLGGVFFVFSVVTAGLGGLLLMPLFPLLAVFHAVCTVIAAIKANNGQSYRYPFCLRLIN